MGVLLGLKRAGFEEEDDPRPSGKRGDAEGGPGGGRVQAAPHRIDKEADEGGGGHLQEAQEELEDQFTHVATLYEQGEITLMTRRRGAPRGYEGLLQRRRTGGRRRRGGRAP